MEVTLEAIQEFLKAQNIAVRMEKKDQEIPLDHLLLEFGVDEKKRPQNINLYVVEKDVASLQNQKNRTKATFIHLYMPLPIHIQDQAIGDIARYLLFINKSLEFEGFGMSEVDRLIYFRHDLHASLKQLSNEVLLGLIGYILLIVDTFSSRLEQIAELEKTFLETIEETLNMPFA